jgi:hypothetical protein
MSSQLYSDLYGDETINTDLSYSEKKKLARQIGELTVDDHIHILRYIIESSDNDNKDQLYTVNNNWTLFDLTDLDRKIQYGVKKIVELSLANIEMKKNKSLALEEHEAKLKELNNNIITNNLPKTIKD